jgi:hypothetical protein
METRSENEEELALRVEAQVKDAAQHMERRQNPPQPKEAWGLLPAPWEPLPDWLGTPTETKGLIDTERELRSEGRHEAIPFHVPYNPLNKNDLKNNLDEAEKATPDVDVQRAGHERSLPVSQDTEKIHEPPAPSGPGDLEAELDELARQVYARLKRRLSLEKRRDQR